MQLAMLTMEIVSLAMLERDSATEPVLLVPLALSHLEEMLAVQLVVQPARLAQLPQDFA